MGELEGVAIQGREGRGIDGAIEFGLIGLFSEWA